MFLYARFLYSGVWTFFNVFCFHLSEQNAHFNVLISSNVWNNYDVDPVRVPGLVHFFDRYLRSV